MLKSPCFDCIIVYCLIADLWCKMLNKLHVMKYVFDLINSLLNQVITQSSN